MSFRDLVAPKGAEPDEVLLDEPVDAAPPPITRTGGGFRDLVDPAEAKPTDAFGNVKSGSSSTGTDAGQLEPGNIDLRKQPKIRNADGSISTVRSMSFEDNGVETLIPTTSDRGDRILSDAEAVAQYRRTGRHLGKFVNPDSATQYAIRLHEDYAAGKFDSAPKSDPQAPFVDVAAIRAEKARKLAAMPLGPTFLDGVVERYAEPTAAFASGVAENTGPAIAGGLGGAAIGAAAGAPVFGLGAIPGALLGLVGGVGTALGAAKLQKAALEKYRPELNADLETLAADNPKMTMAGAFVPGVIGSGPTTAGVRAGIKGLTGKALSAAEKEALVRAGVSGGMGTASAVVGGIMQGQAPTAGDLAVGTLLGLFGGKIGHAAEGKVAGKGNPAKAQADLAAELAKAGVPKDQAAKAAAEAIPSRPSTGKKGEAKVPPVEAPAVAVPEGPFVVPEPDMVAGDVPPEPPPPGTPPPSQPPPSDGPPPRTPHGQIDQKIAGLITEGRKIQPKTARLYREERSRRFRQAEGLMATPEGEATLGKVKGTMKGELPKEAFEPIRPLLSDEEVTSAYNRVFSFKDMNTAERFRAGNALNKILDPDVRVAPQKNELALLNRIFPGTVDAILKTRSWKEKFGDLGLRVAGLPRELSTVVDMSAPLRQGLLLTAGRPRQSIPAFGRMHQAFFSEKAYMALEQNVRSRPNSKLYEESGLYLAPTMEPKARARDLFRLRDDVGQREEAFSSGLGEMIPGAGHVVRASNRAYNAYLNKLRVDVFDSIEGEWRKGGITPESDMPKYEALADYLNTASGRGSYGTGKMGTALERASPVLNGALFSPRFVAARLKTLGNVVTAGRYSKMPREVRVEMLRDTLSTVGAGLAAISLAKLAGGDKVKVDADPRSGAFGKIRVGNTSLDVWGGFSQWTRLVAQLATGQTIDSQGDTRILNLNPRDPTAKTYADVLARFGRSKLAPVPGALVDVLTGTDFNGDELDKTTIAQKIAPMFLMDMKAAIEDGGLLGGAMAAPGFYGVGVQTYDRPAQDIEDGLRAGMDMNQKISESLDNGDLTMNQVERVVKRAQVGTLLARYRQLPLEDLQATLKKQDARIQQTFEPLVELKTLRRQEAILKATKGAGRAGSKEYEALGRMRSRIRQLTDTIIEIEDVAE